MRKFYFLMLVAMIGVVFSSCEKQKEFFVTDIQGKWCKDGQQDFRRFSTDKATQSGYFWGWEWNEDQDVQESDVKNSPQGNGWFMYTIEGNQLLEIEKTEYGWADIPKAYIITELTSTKLVYYPKGFPKDKRYYTKK